jgi:hypothetical protein
MELYKPFKIVIGVLLLLSSVTIFALLFLEPDSLALLFNFSIDITAENLGEAIAGAMAAIGAGIAFLIFMIIVAIFNLIIYLVIGSLTLGLKKSKTILIIVVILTAYALFLEIRVIIISTMGGLPSTILIVRLISDITIIGLSGYLLFQLFKRKEIVPQI